MPSRWWVPIPGLRPEYVRLEHLHALVSGWFDHTAPEHNAGEKPYTVTPLATRAGVTGVEVATVMSDAAERLLMAIGGHPEVRLGNMHRRVGQPRLLVQESWEQLAAYDGCTRWRLEFQTPTTFRTGDRATPMPSLPTIFGGLARAWQQWSEGVAALEAPAGSAVWITDLDLHSELVELTIRTRKSHEPMRLRMPGVVGALDLRCDDPDQARRAGPLLRLAGYVGVGSMTRKGLGVTRVSGGRSEGQCHGAVG